MIIYSASLTRRATAAAVIFAASTGGGAIGGQIYQAKQKPRYFIGHTVSFCCVALQSILIITLRLILMRINRRREKMNDDEKQRQIEKYGGEQLAGDHHPDFRYIL